MESRLRKTLARTHLSVRLLQFLANYSKRTLAKLFIGVGIVSTLFFLAICAPFISPYDPTAMIFPMATPPNRTNLMGTDHLGRDIFSRICWGGRASLLSALVAMMIATSFGIPLGALSGYFGGKFDLAIATTMDSFYAFPHYITALLITILMGRDPTIIALAVGIAYIPYFFRIVRSVAMSVKERAFIEEEKAIGASSLFIVRHHILPYTVSSIMVFFSLSISRSILLIAGLGFLGLGIQPPTPEWGTDMRFGRDLFLLGKWWALLPPGLMVFFAVLGFNLLGEGLNSIFQERKGGRFTVA